MVLEEPVEVISDAGDGRQRSGTYLGTGFTIRADPPAGDPLA
jgi:hypothetical protein